MKFGSRPNDPSRRRGGGGGQFIRSFKKNTTTLLRFMEEQKAGMDEYGGWTEYWEHFDQSIQRSYPCNSEYREKCPGCIADLRASKKYLVNAVRPDEGYVDLYKIPSTAFDELERQSLKDGGSITARDWGIVRIDDGDGTKYAVDREEKYDVADEIVKKFQEQRKDHERALIEAYIEAHGEPPYDPEGDADPEMIKELLAKREEQEDARESKAVKAVQRVEEKYAAKTAAPAVKNSIRKPQTAQEFTERDGDPPSEPAVAVVDNEQGEETEETVELTMDEIAAMDAEALRKLFGVAGLQAPETDDADELRDALVTALG